MEPFHVGQPGASSVVSGRFKGVVRPMRPASRSTSNVRSLLRQPLYRGVARRGRLKQHDEDGNPVFAVNPDSEHVIFYSPDWRIVSDVLADAVEARFADEDRRKFGPRVGAKAKYLLWGGMLTCPSCGARLKP